MKITPEMREKVRSIIRDDVSEIKKCHIVEEIMSILVEKGLDICSIGKIVHKFKYYVKSGFSVELLRLRDDCKKITPEFITKTPKSNHYSIHKDNYSNTRSEKSSINQDDVINLKITLETCESIEKFLEAI